MVIDKLSGSRVYFEVTVSKELFEHGLDHAFEKVIQDVEIKGFRKGKAPRNVFEAKYGVESLYEEAVNHVLQETYYNTVIENNIDVVAQPKIDLDFETVKRGQDFIYKVTVAVRPEIKLGEYLGTKVELLKPEASDAEVLAEVNKLLDQHAEMIVKEAGTLENGDTAVFDFSGSVDGEKFEGGTAENYELVIGSGNFIPGFEEQMVGMVSEEERDINVTFPEEYHEKSLAGKAAVFACKLHEMKTRQVPELNDDFVAELEDEALKTVEDLNNKVKADIVAQKEAQNKNQVRVQVIKTAVENAEFDIPEEMILEEAQRSLEQSKQQISQYGLDFNTYLQYMGKTEEAFLEDLKEQSKKTLEEQLVVEEIGKQEKLEATKEEIEAKYAEIVEQYKAQNVTLEQAKQAIPESAIVSEIVYGKTIDLLTDKAVINQ